MMPSRILWAINLITKVKKKKRHKEQDIVSKELPYLSFQTANILKMWCHCLLFNFTCIRTIFCWLLVQSYCSVSAFGEPKPNSPPSWTSIHYLYLLIPFFRVTGICQRLSQLSSGKKRQGDTLVRATHTLTFTQSSINLTYVYLDCERKLDYLNKPHAGKWGEDANSIQNEPSWGPNQEPSLCEATVLQIYGSPWWTIKLNSTQYNSKEGQIERLKMDL